jgi:hypothetical protein
MAAYNDVEVYLYQRFVLDISPCPYTKPGMK